MCCCMKVSVNLFMNLLQRVCDNIMQLIYCQRQWPPSQADAQSGPPSCGSLALAIADEDQYQYHHQNSSNGRKPQQPVDRDALRDVDSGEAIDRGKGSSIYNVIYDTVELESYYYDVGRRQCEALLKGYKEGTCLVRPFKFKQSHIRYILSIKATSNYFHLFIRQTGPNRMYALGLEKQNERQFKFPADIVLYYRTHLLKCARNKIQIMLYLVPLENTEMIEPAGTAPTVPQKKSLKFRP
ncbi:uncharacterized protein LOC129762527 [Toxorhynchites rutilus septentrionalis]|uniref:uncharacterized protein LOC129762527 n=1 Tax=Toxorhynchites rutilus septentrionalis TaxID=329112 RepID=UPI002478A921|nr:uncharacterized protein LOC129762527 [Toxorhynchites rutilus septentrionalis]